ncbi:hypothetical protein Tco_1213281 [Tanacetum coccineum]
MSFITAQQAKLDIELVPKEKRLEIMFQRVTWTNSGIPSKSMTLPTVHSQDFDELPTDEVIVSFFKELGHIGEIKSITDVVVDQMHQPWKTFATIINRSLSGKTSSLDKLRLSRAQILWDPDRMPLTKAKGQIPQKDKIHNDSGDDNTQSNKEKGSDSDHETDGNETGSESDQEENEEEVEDDEEEKEDEFVKTLSNYKSTDDEDETNEESKVKDNAEGDEDKGMDYTTNQFDDDVDVRLKKLVNADEGFFQKEGTDAEMINVQQGNENLDITLNQVIEDAYVTISTTAKKTEVPVTSSSHLSDLASKFLNFLDISHTDAKIVSPMDVHVHHEIPTLEKEVTELKKDDLLNTQVTDLVDEHLDSRLGATRDEFMSYLSASITARIIEKVKINLPQILPKEVSNFAPLVIKSMVTESLEHVVLAKESSQLQSTYEAVASLTEFELKKILIDKMDESQSYLIATEHKECYDGLIKSYELNKSLFSTYDNVYSLLKRSQQ